ncbi:polyketide beta-ketoacyl:ACP synthase [Paenibacillus jamilae]|uniref:Polyketide beta-ketoacyl:ACP synthase n=2 Tax=Paenibacillus TaxID=44249 RepID=E3E980_PAEPS|nr:MULTISPECIES: beta-ketoacyl synthase N-terminal-like domain-containing protein [Paenibacillus]ADO57353.1 polyketide beta-ketoacyl:ACP synthase [Paenibacillus polymyxa SC2]AUO08135.1 polyketide beta-ketoacyl:ACP synthase [Paenibacillus sp. lzh-N1]KTS80475.1 polyketide beta-ketoacyl:ACP synthase [Paenibacillus jamilae]TKH35336.1 polyketide beta-ketoacyl:ACP synthase [Paenibacillus polymyxa]WPQ55131.1 beta-ketoacyl synthase N-terminal-like domain-containing protein [Paenibacillus polymyxa]
MRSMPNYKQPELVITGIGVTSAIGQGKTAFASALFKGQHAFGVMQRPGREGEASFIGAELPSLSYPESISKRMLRTASFSGQVAMVTLQEAWDDAKLDHVDPSRIGLVIGGSNFQQRELFQTYEAYREKMHFVPPTYGLSFMDTDLCGLCTEQFGIQGLAYTVGGASASGQVAIIQAIEAIQANRVDVCIAMGALMDISYLECQALRSLGAMGSDRYANEPAKACRPFDQMRDGFIYGESCGVIVIERSDFAMKRQGKSYAKLTGWDMGMDRNRNPNPSYEGEVQVIKRALKKAKLQPEKIDYINPHGTGSVVGDEIEIKAIQDCNLSHAYINATKSIIGHGLSAAGTVEIIATLLQMKESKLHPTRNLEKPIGVDCNWVKNEPIPAAIHNTMNLSMGFGGINTAICMQKCESGI